MHLPKERKKKEEENVIIWSNWIPLRYISTYTKVNLYAFVVGVKSVMC